VIASCWVSGEIGGWTRARSGHCYFTLKDDRAQLRCVMWRSDARQLPIDPDEGMGPGQEQEIDRVYAMYPHLADDDFVAEHLDEWLR